MFLSIHTLSAGRLLRVLALLLAGPAFLAVAHAQPVPPEVVWEQDADARTVAFSPDGQHVVSGGIRRFTPYTYGRVDVFDAANGVPLAYAESHTAAAIIGRTNEVALSPDGQTLATAHGGVHCQAHGGCYAERPGLLTWTFPGLVPLAGRTDVALVDAVDFAPDGGTLAAAYFYDNQGLVSIHDAATLATVEALAGHGREARGVRYSPDGTRLASVGNGSLSDGRLRAWDPATGALVYSVQHGSYSNGGVPVSVAYSPDGALIATAGEGSGAHVRVWDAETGALLLDLDALIEPDAYGAAAIVAFTPNGAYVVGGLNQYVSGSGHWSGLIRFWDAATGEVVMEYADTGPPPYHGGVRALAFSEAEDHRFAYVVGSLVKVAETTLSLSGGSAPVTVAIAAVDPPVTIPPEGGPLDYRVTLTNTTDQPRTVEAWVSATLPDGAPFGPVQGPRTLTLGPHETVGPLTFTRRVPAAAAAGTYSVTVNVGDYPASVASSDSFDFVKAEAARDLSVASSVATADGAYPNPFRGRTTIRFTADEATDVRLAVYDALGREVAVLADGPVAAGSHAVVFDGTGLPGGVYAWRLTAEGQVSSGRLTVVR